jgi:cytochrome c oxidase subunit II
VKRHPGAVAAALLPPLVLAACTGVQTPLDPFGPQASILADLSWLLFAGGAAIFVLVLALLAWALLAPAGLRHAIGSRGFVVGGGIVFPVVTLAALLVHTGGISRALVLAPPERPLRIEVIGRQYWWEVRYPDAPGEAVTANEIRLPVGREVELLLSSGDVIHSLWIPNLHGKLDMIPGRVTRLRFSADRTGPLKGHCAEFCGLQHAMMQLWVVVEESEAFEAWLARQQEPVPLPSGPVAARGMRVFGEAGCGACHAVRGTEWRGRLAPDLSRMGSRLSLGAGVLENHRGTLAGWIAGTQDIKPGNAMPAFGRALHGEDLLALAAWLEELR